MTEQPTDPETDPAPTPGADDVDELVREYVRNALSDPDRRERLDLLLATDPGSLDPSERRLVEIARDELTRTEGG